MPRRTNLVVSYSLLRVIFKEIVAKIWKIKSSIPFKIIGIPFLKSHIITAID